MNKFCTMLSYFSILFVLMVSGIFGEENNAFSFGNETVIDNKNQTLNVEEHESSEGDTLVGLKLQILPASNKTLHLNANDDNVQKTSISSNILDENEKSHNWKDFQNGTFTTTIVNKANKTVKIKIRKVKLNNTLDDHKSFQESPPSDHSKSSNYTDQEPSGSSIHIEFNSYPQNRKSIEIENDKRFHNWTAIDSDKFSDPNNTLTITGENFEVNAQNLSQTQNLIPSQPEYQLEIPGPVSIIQNSTQNFNDWRGTPTFTEDHNVNRFQNFSQSFENEENLTLPTAASLTSDGILIAADRTPRFLEEYEKPLQNETNFQFNTINFDNSSNWKGIDFETNQTIELNNQEVFPNFNFQQNSSDSKIPQYLNGTSSSSNDKDYEVLDKLNQFKIQYMNENRKLLQNQNFNQIQFDGSDWKAVIVGALPITTNNTSATGDQTINVPSSSNIRYAEASESGSQNMQPSNSTLDFDTKARYADYQPSGSADNFQLQPLEENFEEYNHESDVDHQVPNFNDEVQISRPTVHDQFENSNFENQATEKFIPNNNWNLDEDWKVIDGNTKPHHISTHTEIKIENHVPFPYPIVKNVLYPVEKKVPFPIKVEVPSPYPVIKEIHVPKKVSVTVPVPIYKPVPIEKVVKYPVRVPVDQPYPVEVKVPHYYPVEVQIPFPVKVKVPKPIPIIKKVPYEVKHIYHVPKPYPVHKDVYYPVKVHFERLVRYNVYKPLPYKVYKNVYFPYYIEKPYPVKVYEDKGVHASVGQKPQSFNHDHHVIENHKPHIFNHDHHVIENHKPHIFDHGHHLIENHKPHIFTHDHHLIENHKPHIFNHDHHLIENHKPEIFNHDHHSIENHKPEIFNHDHHLIKNHKPDIFNHDHHLVENHKPEIFNHDHHLIENHKPEIFNHDHHAIENHKPFQYNEHPETIPVYENSQEKPHSEFESNDNTWKVNYDPYG